MGIVWINRGKGAVNKSSFGLVPQHICGLLLSKYHKTIVGVVWKFTDKV